MQINEIREGDSDGLLKPAKPQSNEVPNSEPALQTDLIQINFKRDGRFILALRNLVSAEPSIKKQGEAQTQARLDLYTLIANYHDPDIQQVNELEKLDKRFHRLSKLSGKDSVFLEAELKSLLDLTYENAKTDYRPASEPYKGLKISPDLRPAILDAMLIASKGYSNFIGKVIEEGPKDKRFNDVMKFVKSLDSASLEHFVYNAEFLPDAKNDNLTKTLLSLMDDTKVLELLYKGSQDALADETTSMEYTESKQLILLTAMKNFSGQIPLENLKEQFVQAVSYNALDLVCEVIKNRYPEEAANLFLDYARESPNEYSKREDCKQTVAISHYAKLLGEEAIPEIKEIARNNNDNSMILLGCAETLIAKFGEKGITALEELIDEDFEANRPSTLLATIARQMDFNTAFKSVLKKVLSKPIDVTDEFLKIHTADMRVVTEKKKYLDYRLVKVRLPFLVYSIDIDTFSNWVIDKDSSNGRLSKLAENSRKLLIKGIEIEEEEESKDDDEKSFLLRKHVIDYAKSKKGAELRTLIGM